MGFCDIVEESGFVGGTSETDWVQSLHQAHLSQVFTQNKVSINGRCLLLHSAIGSITKAMPFLKILVTLRTRPVDGFDRDVDLVHNRLDQLA